MTQMICLYQLYHRLSNHQTLDRNHSIVARTASSPPPSRQSRPRRPTHTEANPPSPPVSHQNVVNFSFSFHNSRPRDYNPLRFPFLCFSSFLWLVHEQCDGSSVQDHGVRRPLDRTVTSSLALLVRPVLPRLELGNTCNDTGGVTFQPEKTRFRRPSKGPKSVGGTYPWPGCSNEYPASEGCSGGRR